jgi:hypothetical protein
MSSIDDKIATLESILGRMTYVVDGDYVLADHTNTFIDFLTVAVDLLDEIYELFKAKTGRTLPDAELWIDLAKSRLQFAVKVKFGDVVATRDHNIVIDTLKPIELALVAIEQNL